MSKLLKFNTGDLLFIALMLVPGLVLLSTTGDISIYFAYDVLDGQFLYVLSKFFGLYAIIFVCAQLLYGLYLSIPNKKNQIESCKYLHRALGKLTVVFIVLHFSLFVLAASLRNGYFAYKLLLPNILGNFYPSMLSLGIIAFILIVISLVSIYLYQKNKLKIYKWGHRLVLPAFILILVHSYTIGSETRVYAMQITYILMLVGLIYLFTLKILKSN